MASNNRASFWNDELKKLLDTLIAYQLEFGQEQPVSWVQIAFQFEEATGKKCHSHTLKNKHGQMKVWWRLWKDFKHRETGLSWDAEKGCVNAPNEWWDKKIGENVHFKQFRTKGISPDLEDLLDQVYGRMIEELQLGDGPDSDDDTPFGTGAIRDILEQMICDNQGGR